MQTRQFVAYRPSWQTAATNFQQQLKQSLSPWFKASSHVGSTAIPTIPAQPIIDIALLVTDMTAATKALAATPVPNQPQTYQLTIQGQAFQLIFFTDATQYQRLINFRDYLNAHRTDSRKYTAVRTKAAAVPDYYAAKSLFITSINGKASEWLLTKATHEHHDRTVRAELVNMCLIMNPVTHEVVVENKIDSQWPGLTLPGGHVDPGESQVTAMQREVREETGLTVSHLKLVGTVTWVENAAGDVSLGTLYTTTDYTGNLLAGSYEGAISWHPLTTLATAKLAPGIAQLLKVFTDPNLNEAFWGFEDNQLKVY